MSVPVVLFDACVLYPAPLRDLLMHLSLTGLFRAKWTNEIHEEWMRNLLKKRPDLAAAQLERTRDLMNAHILDVLVEDYQALIPKISLPDPHDSHVLAAAIKSKASLIITYNLKDFPLHELEKYRIQAIHPDKFVTQLFLENSEIILRQVERLRHGLKNPPLNSAEHLAVLSQQGLECFVRELGKF